MKNKSSHKYQSLILLVAMFLVNVLNYGLNLILARYMGPHLYAEAHVLSTFVLGISFLGVSVQMTAAKLFAENHSKKIIKQFYKYLLIFSVIIALFGLILLPRLSSFLHMQSAWSLAIVIMAIPAYLTLSYKRGSLQGSDNLVRFSASFVVETIVRLVVSLLAIYLLSDDSTVIIALAVAFFLSFLIPVFFANTKFYINKYSDTEGSDAMKSVLKFVFFFMLYELAQVLISNGDYFVVKSQFDGQAAGLYASITLIGKMIFYAAWVFVMIMFPRLISARKNGQSTTKIFLFTLGLVISGGLAATGVCYVFGEQLMGILFGEQYLAGATYMANYALLTTLFAAANVIIYNFISQSDFTLAFIASIIGLLEIVLLTVLDHTLTNVVMIQIVLMSILFTVAIAYYIKKEWTSTQKAKIIALQYS